MKNTVNKLSETNFHYINDGNIQRNNIYPYFHKKDTIDYSNGLNLRVVSNKKDLMNFFLIPWKIYKHDPYWIPSLLGDMKNFFSKKNPFWIHSEAKLFILLKNEEIVGRIAAFIDYLYCKKIHEKVGFFGYFECFDHYEYADILFSAAQNWLKSKNISRMQGPINGRIDNGCGFLYSGENTYPGILSVHSYLYYNSFAETFGLDPIRDFVEYRLDLQKSIPDEVKQKSRKCSESGVKIRTFNRMRTKKELDWWAPLFLETFQDHWGFVPVPADEVRLRYGIKQLRWIVEPNLFLIAEINNKPIGYIWSTPDYNQILKKINGKIDLLNIFKLIYNKSKINKGKIQYIGVKKEFRHKDISSLLNYKTIIEMKKMGYKSTVVSCIDAKNTNAIQTISNTGAIPYRKYQIYGKNI
jgi:hypothetical protein